MGFHCGTTMIGRGRAAPEDGTAVTKSPDVVASGRPKTFN
jgi:hypothetical protein